LEALFFAKDLFTGETFKGCMMMYLNYTRRLSKLLKTRYSTGELGESGIGNTYVMDDDADLGVTSLRAILDIGLLDMQPQYIEADDADITVVDASSDMLVIDITSSKEL
jgi:predicted amino acid racemase